MSRLLKPAGIDGPGELVELVSEAIGEITCGGVLLDGALGNEEFGYFDLVAADENGEGVFFFINVSGSESEYLRLLKCIRWYRDNRRVLQKLYAGRIALGQVPHVIVVAPMYSNTIRKVLLNVLEGRITLVKYVCFQDSDGQKSLSIEKVEDSPPATENTGRAQILETPQATEAGRPQIPQAERITDLREFRRKMGNDFSNVSDEELLDLLG
jgi:hypothetical protein